MVKGASTNSHRRSTTLMAGRIPKISTPYHRQRPVRRLYNFYACCYYLQDLILCLRIFKHNIPFILFYDYYPMAISIILTPREQNIKGFFCLSIFIACPAEASHENADAYFGQLLLYRRKYIITCFNDSTSSTNFA